MLSRRHFVTGVVVVALASVLYLLPDSIDSPDRTPVASPAYTAAAPPPIPLEYMPPPFEERRIVFPAMGEGPPSQSAAFCDDGNWSRLDLVVSRSDNGAFWVDEDAWNRELTGSKVGLASWMSQCHGDGAPIEIVAADSGALLATYDARTGLRLNP